TVLVQVHGFLENIRAPSEPRTQRTRGVSAFRCGNHRLHREYAACAPRTSIWDVHFGRSLMKRILPKGLTLIFIACGWPGGANSFRSLGVTANCSRSESFTLLPSESLRPFAARASQCGTTTMLCGLSSLATIK